MLLIDPFKMLRNLCLMIISLLMITSCYTRNEHELASEPSNLIEKDMFVLVLADIEIAESALRQKQNHGHEIDDIREMYYKSIFTNYGISREQFDSSMAYYKQDLEAINQIYEEVITRLSVIESEVEHE